MKNLYYILILVLITSCKNNEEKNKPEGNQKAASVESGQLLFEENNCVVCHQINQKVVGPSLQETAKIYKQKNANLVSFLKGNAQPIVNPELYETMKVNLEITKKMSDEELKSLELYILSQAK